MHLGAHSRVLKVLDDIIAKIWLHGYWVRDLFSAASDGVPPAKSYGTLVATMKSPLTEIPEIVTISVVDPPSEVVSVEVKLSLEVVDGFVVMLDSEGGVTIVINEEIAMLEMGGLELEVIVLVDVPVVMLEVGG